MQTQIVKMINDFEHGRLSRRQLIAYLTGMFAGSKSRGQISTFNILPEPTARHYQLLVIC